MKQSVQYLLVINHFVSSITSAVEQLRKQPEFNNLEIILLTESPNKYVQLINESVPTIIVACKFKTAQEIERALKPFKPYLSGVICRGDEHIQFLRQVIPFLPQNVRVSSLSSLEKATNKLLMRQEFLQHCPAITPLFLTVHDSSPKTIAKIEEQLSYPLIVKPTNLASSLLIQACHTHEELTKALQLINSKIAAIYRRENRHGTPQVIVEEYLEGELYSLDGYCFENQVYFCPPIYQIPASKRGVDDYSVYERHLPTYLSAQEIVAAQKASQQAISSVGLSNSAVHLDLMLTANGWKVIELGPRLGRFRHRMYQLGYGIDHSLNDVKIHLGIAPLIPNHLQQFCSAFSIYPHQEGVLKRIDGIEHIANDQAIKFLKLFAEPGAHCYLAKHGGKSLAEIVIATNDLEKYSELRDYIEKKVKAVIA